MIVREPLKVAYLNAQAQQEKAEDEQAEAQGFDATALEDLNDQAQREKVEDERAEAWGFDALALEEMIRRWGIKAVLTELAVIHERVHPDGSKVLWRIPSKAYLTGHYDNPNPCNCDEF
jgi:hypothetical protein